MPKAPKKIQKWLDIAKEALEVAKDLFRAGRYLYTTFFCQQAAEKAFKGVIEKKLKEEPPYIHDLVKLADLAGYSRDEMTTGYLEDLNLHYIKGRYYGRT